MVDIKRKIGRSQQVADSIRGMIQSGQWPVGTRLPTTRDLASRYNVSRNTVVTALRELEVQKLIDCQPRQATVVISQTIGSIQAGIDKKRIAIVSSRNPGASQLSKDYSYGFAILDVVQHDLFDAHYEMITFPHFHNEPNPVEALTSRIEQIASELAGVIIFPYPEMECLLSVLDQKDIPWVTVQRVHHRVHYNYVAANNYSAGRLVGECFLALGYQRVLLLDAQPMPLDSELQKFTGLLSAYLAANVPVIQTQLLVCEDVLEETAYQKISTYLKNNSIPQGIFARGDSLAIGAVRACRDAGLSIPDDVSIVGSTGLDVSAFCNPPLTVASQPMGAIGHAVASMLLNMIETGQRRVAGQTINCTIDLRESLKITPEVTRLIQSQEQEIVPCHGHEVNSSSKPLVLET